MQDQNDYPGDAIAAAEPASSVPDAAEEPTAIEEISGISGDHVVGVSLSKPPEAIGEPLEEDPYEQAIREATADVKEAKEEMLQTAAHALRADEDYKEARRELKRARKRLGKLTSG